MDAKVLLQSAFFVDMLIEVKCLTMINQEKSISIINLWDAVETWKSNYECLLKKIKKNPTFIFELPSLKPDIDSTESSEDGEFTATK